MASTTGNSKTDAVIGTGIAMPVAFSNVRGNQLLTLVTGPDVISQSIHMILDTPLGSRINNNEFGSDVRSLLFEPNDTILKDLLYYAVVTSIKRWEARITVTNVTFQSLAIGAADPNMDPNQINIVISYIINSTHQQGSYVYPFVRSGAPYSVLITGKSKFNLTSQTITNASNA